MVTLLGLLHTCLGVSVLLCLGGYHKDDETKEWLIHHAISCVITEPHAHKSNMAAVVCVYQLAL